MKSMADDKTGIHSIELQIRVLRLSTDDHGTMPYNGNDAT